MSESLVAACASRWDDPCHRLVPVKYKDRPAASHVIEVAGEIILQLPNLGLLHIAILAKFYDRVKNANRD